MAITRRSFTGLFAALIASGSTRAGDLLRFSARGPPSPPTPAPILDYGTRTAEMLARSQCWSNGIREALLRDFLKEGWIATERYYEDDWELTAEVDGEDASKLPREYPEHPG